DAKPKRGKIFFMKLVSLVMGFTFAIKLMENGEELASGEYKKLIEEVPEAEKIMADEQRHENELIELLDEERLQYVGSMVLGLNDALVELTGTLAGLTFAMQNTRLVALSGLITGISATLSMASSEYLAAKNKGDAYSFISCVYTCIAYVITVALLVLPYLIFPSDGYVAALAVMIVIVILIIAFFNYYISVAKSQPFKRRFFEMAAISLSVALISFIIGLFVKKFLGIEI
ncbi:MAG: VIT1/CCC1 transporter family protein, partial [Oscillospiraceae bacterium]